MDLESLSTLSRALTYYRIKHGHRRVDTKGNEFEHEIIIGPGMAFGNAIAANKFMDAIAREYNLDDSARKRLPDGWRL